MMLRVQRSLECLDQWTMEELSGYNTCFPPKNRGNDEVTEMYYYKSPLLLTLIN